MIRLALRVPAEHAEIVLAELLELAPAGVEEVRHSSAREPLDGDAFDASGETVEYAVYGAPGELPELGSLHAAIGEVPVEVHTSEVADDWAERWKQFHRPVLVEGPDRSLHVRAPWMAPCGRESAEEIVIDPGQAFGTGAHPTTRMCLDLLLELCAAEPSRPPVLDVGSGSGVLAIAAARLGYRPVLALDLEPQSVEAIAANAQANGVELLVRRFDLRRDPLPELQDGAQDERGLVLKAVDAPLILANLLRPLLVDLASCIRRPPRHLIASGLLREEADEIARVFAERLSLRERERREQGDWAALLLSR